MLTLATITGSGDTTVAIPASVGVPAIVHAEYDGDASFVVDGLDAHGSHLTVLANTLGRYDGTFPVGFVDQADVPTTSLRVETIGAWHLDIASAVLAHLIPAGGQLGKGDAVLLYKGPAVSAHITYPGTSAFAIETFDGKVVTMLVTTVGPYDARITLPAGPAFISVTAAGDWSMSLG